MISINDVTFVAAGHARSADGGETAMEAFVSRFQLEIEPEAARVARFTAKRGRCPSRI